MFAKFYRDANAILSKVSKRENKPISRDAILTRAKKIENELTDKGLRFDKRFRMLFGNKERTGYDRKIVFALTLCNTFILSYASLYTTKVSYPIHLICFFIALIGIIIPALFIREGSKLYTNYEKKLDGFISDFDSTYGTDRYKKGISDLTGDVLNDEYENMMESIGVGDEEEVLNSLKNLMTNKIWREKILESASPKLAPYLQNPEIKALIMKYSK